MLKNSWSQRLFSGRKTAVHRQSQKVTSNGPNKAKQDFLSNIVEEGSMEDLPKTFEQEEQYMNDCLKSVGSSVEDVRNLEVEEYDFDDFNSIASTTSMLNLTSDIDDRLRISSPLPVKSISQTSRGPTDDLTNSKQPNGFVMYNSNDNLTNFQKSLSRVQNWDRLGRGGVPEDWSQVLLQACEAGDLITVQNAISHLGATKESLINARDSSGNTPLHKAVQNGKLQCLQWLVKRAPIEAVAIGNHDGVTPAAMATQCGQVECLEWLVDQTNARQELEKENSFTLLHLAAKEGQEECLRFLLSYVQSQILAVSDICDNNGVTPAHLAAREGHLECLQTLVEFNSNVTLTDREDCTPSDYAFRAGQTSCGRYLVAVEMCVDLTARLECCMKENEDLRNRLQAVENNSPVLMPDRPEVVGGDQSDSSSSVSMDSIIYPGGKISRSLDTRRSSSAPDGESPKGTKKEGTVYQYQANGYLAPAPTPVNHGRSRDDPYMRRRGSFPLTCWEKSSDAADKYEINNKTKVHDKTNRSSSPITNTRSGVTRPPLSSNEPSVLVRPRSLTTQGAIVTRPPPRNDERPVCTRASPTADERTVVYSPALRTPDSSAFATTKKQSRARVRFEDSRDQLNTKVQSDNSSTSEMSNSVSSSSSSQFPYSSDHLTASSTETVLVAPSFEQRHPSYNNSRRHNRIGGTNYSGSIVQKQVEKINQIRRNEIITDKSQLSTDNVSRNGVHSKRQLKHSWIIPKNSTHSTPNQYYSTKDRVNDYEFLLADKSANQRHSWHGSYLGEDRLVINSYDANSVQRARASWIDQRDCFKGRDLNAGNTDSERTGIRKLNSPRSHYYDTMATGENSFDSLGTYYDEKPWYETEEVEL